jgi:hypothetical protein
MWAKRVKSALAMHSIGDRVMQLAAAQERERLWMVGPPRLRKAKSIGWSAENTRYARPVQRGWRPSGSHSDNAGTSDCTRPVGGQRHGGKDRLDQTHARHHRRHQRGVLPQVPDRLCATAGPGT